MSLADEISGSLKPGSHAIHLYESPAQQKDLLASFFQQGLEDGEHCLFFSGPKSAPDWYQELQASGVDAERESQRGALLVVDRGDWRPEGRFNSLLQARKVLGLVERLMDGSSGLRIASDARWALKPELPADQLCHWEATADLIYKGEEIRAICQYNLHEHASEAIHSALRTHAIVILDGRYYSNPYYEAPLILEREPALNHSHGDARLISEMLARLGAGP